MQTVAQAVQLDSERMEPDCGYSGLDLPRMPNESGVVHFATFKLSLWTKTVAMNHEPVSRAATLISK